ncbi:hypothetical protein Peur_022525 [Populus x canadensis]
MTGWRRAWWIAHSWFLIPKTISSLFNPPHKTNLRLAYNPAKANTYLKQLYKETPSDQFCLPSKYKMRKPKLLGKNWVHI